MEQIVKSDNKHHGFTLIEVLISILLLLIISLGLLGAMNYFITKTIENNLRNEAIKIAQECAEKLRHFNKCTSNATENPAHGNITRRVGNSVYTFEISYTNPDSFQHGNNQVAILVKYRYRGKEYTYVIRTTVFKK